MTISDSTIEELVSRYDQVAKRYVRVPHHIYEPIMMNALSHRELRVLLLVVRLSFGCQKNYALMRLADFKLVGLYPSDARKTLLALEKKEVLQWHRAAHTITLNEEAFRWKVNEYSTNNQQTKPLSDLLRENLVKRAPHEEQAAQKEGGETLVATDENSQESGKNHILKQTERYERNVKSTTNRGEEKVEDARDLWEVLTDELGVDRRVAYDLIENIDEEILWDTYRAYTKQAGEIENPAGWFVDVAKKNSSANKEGDSD